MSDRDEDLVRGLPHALPAGERVLWQGSPRWWSLAKYTFKIHWVFGYFVVLTGLRATFQWASNAPADSSVWTMLGVFATALALLVAFAWANARTTVYTITDRRVVIQTGVALSMSWNFPFKQLASADLLNRGPEGDIVLRMVDAAKVRWVYLWPSVKPWPIWRARPSLRSIPEPERVAKVLKDAVAQWGSGTSATTVVVNERVVNESVAAPNKPRAQDRKASVVAAGNPIAQAGQ